MKGNGQIDNEQLAIGNWQLALGLWIRFFGYEGEWANRQWAMGNWL
jgi:hypothetical protein